MLDLETLGNSAGAVILQIGAVCFNIAGGIQDETFLCNVDIQSCLNRGMFIDGSNVEFWFRQDHFARSGLLTDPHPKPLDHALEEFHKWWQYHSPVFMWSNGSDYDIPILLEAWCRGRAAKAPWAYKNHRCYRTFLWHARHKGWKSEPRPESLSKHRADHDATFQALNLSSAFNYLQKGE